MFLFGKLWFPPSISLRKTPAGWNMVGRGKVKPEVCNVPYGESGCHRRECGFYFKCNGNRLEGINGNNGLIYVFIRVFFSSSTTLKLRHRNSLSWAPLFRKLHITNTQTMNLLKNTCCLYHLGHDEYHWHRTTYNHKYLFLRQKMFRPQGDASPHFVPVSLRLK